MWYGITYDVRFQNPKDEIKRGLSVFMSEKLRDEAFDEMKRENLRNDEKIEFCDIDFLGRGRMVSPD